MYLWSMCLILRCCVGFRVGIKADSSVLVHGRISYLPSGLPLDQAVVLTHIVCIQGFDLSPSCWIALFTSLLLTSYFPDNILTYLCTYVHTYLRICICNNHLYSTYVRMCDYVCRLCYKFRHWFSLSKGKRFGCQRGVLGVCVALLVAELCQVK